MTPNLHWTDWLTKCVRCVADAAAGVSRGEQQPSPTPVVPSPRTGDEGAAGAGGASGKHQR